MKITKEQLRQIIKEELNEVSLNIPAGAWFDKDSAMAGGEKKKTQASHGEGSMARSQLGRTSELANMIQGMITDETNLEEWVESKITKAQDYLSTVMNYMRGKELK
jgi:hypothetical protein